MNTPTAAAAATEPSHTSYLAFARVLAGCGQPRANESSYVFRPLHPLVSSAVAPTTSARRSEVFRTLGCTEADPSVEHASPTWWTRSRGYRRAPTVSVCPPV